MRAGLESMVEWEGEEAWDWRSVERGLDEWLWGTKGL